MTRSHKYVRCSPCAIIDRWRFRHRRSGQDPLMNFSRDEVRFVRTDFGRFGSKLSNFWSGFLDFWWFLGQEDPNFAQIWCCGCKMALLFLWHVYVNAGMSKNPRNSIPHLLGRSPLLPLHNFMAASTFLTSLSSVSNICKSPVHILLMLMLLLFFVWQHTELAEQWGWWQKLVMFSSRMKL